MEQELARLFEVLRHINDPGIPPIYKFVIGVWYDRNDFNENSLNILGHYHQKRNEIQLTNECEMLYYYNLVARNFGEVDRILGISNKGPQVSFAQYFPEAVQSQKSPSEMHSQVAMEYSQEIQQPVEIEEYKHHIGQSTHSRVPEIDQTKIYQQGYEGQSLHHSNIGPAPRVDDYQGEHLRSAAQSSNSGNITRHTSRSDQQEEQKIIHKDHRQAHNLAAPLNVPYMPTPQGPQEDQARNSEGKNKSIEIVKEVVALESMEPSKLKEIFNISSSGISSNIEEARPQLESANIKEDKTYLDKNKPAVVEDVFRKHVKDGETHQDRAIKDTRLNQLAEVPRKIKHELLYHCETCSIDSSLQGMIRLKECGHYYHIECIRSTALSTLSDNIIPAACPSQKCGQEIDSDVILMILPPEYHERYNELVAISLSTGQYECPKCSYIFTKSEFSSYIYCPKCYKYICKECKLEEHYGKTCMEASRLNRSKFDTQASERSHERRKCLHCDMQEHPGYTCQGYRKYKYGY